jgi:hypothetical protein
MAKEDSGVHISQRTCCDELGVLAATAAEAVKIFCSLKTTFLGS